MGLDARKAVGDRLLLRFLECQSIVQRARKKIGKSPKQQAFLLVEFTSLGGFDVQNA